MLKNNKKAQAEAPTIVWIGATFIILFIMVLYLVFVSVIYINRDKVQVFVKNDYAESNLLLTKQTISFLESEYEIGKKVSSIIVNAEIDSGKAQRIKLFKEKFGEFFDSRVEIGISKPYRGYWIRIYNIDEKESRYASSELSRNYEILKFSAEGLECNVGREDSSLIIIPVYPDKKLVVCLEKND